MRTTHACLLLLQLLASSDGQATAPQCACRSTAPPEDATTMSPDVMTVATTTMAPVAGNATTITPTMVAVATTAAADEVAPSSGPSSGPVVPARLLRGKYVDDVSDRQLQDEDNTSDASDNATTTASQTTTAPTETSDAALCDCPLPQVVSTFATTLTLASADDLAQLNFAQLASQLKSDLSWGDSAEVEVAHVVKIGVQYTLDVDISDVTCKAAVVTAYSVLPADVECGDASSAPAPASSSASASAPAPGPAPGPAERRLQSVKAVTISFEDAQLATAAATTSQDTAQFTTALAGEGVNAVVEVSETVGVSVELTFTVTADEEIAELTPDALVSAVSSTTTDAIAVTAAVTSQVSVTYTRMPCSASDICDGTGGELVADAARIGCDGETCTTEERDRCCANPIGNTGNAQGTCVLGSLSALLLWHFF